VNDLVREMGDELDGIKHTRDRASEGDGFGIDAIDYGLWSMGGV
jgi:hypothetical protein